MNDITFLFSNNVKSILLIYFLTYCLLSLFFKPDKSRIYCGVFAFCGPTTLTKGAYAMILSNIKLLGVLNDSRGGDNAGILINNEVLHTKGTDWKFSELIQRETLENPDPQYSTVIIGHCRKASVGGRDHKYAHPFEIYQNDNDNDFFMAGVHNGTISNWEKLAENYAIDAKKIGNDSKTLLTILSRQRNLKRKQPIFRVLEQYEGYGVFIWYFPDEPNTMYVFKGGSYKSEYDKTLYEERPLYYYECPITKGIYFSSITDPLKMISTDKSKVEQLPVNVVYKITDGKFVKKDEVRINREDLVNYTSYSKKHKVTGFGHQKALYEECGEDDYTYGYNNPSPVNRMIDVAAGKIFNSSSESKKEEKKEEKPFQKVLNSASNYSSSKFDHPSKSLSTLAKEGLIYRSDGLYYYKGRLMNGSFVIDKIAYKCFPINDPVVQKELRDKPFNYETKHFFNGYMLKNSAALDKLSTMLMTCEKLNLDWKTDKTDDYLSHYCSQPVPGINDKTTYYINGLKAGFRVEKPPYSDNKNYVFEKGALTEVLSVKTKEYPEKTPTVNFIIKDPKEIGAAAKELNIPFKKENSAFEDKSRPFALVDAEIIQEFDSRNSEYKEPIIGAEDAYIIDAGEEEILEMYNALLEKCKEQQEYIKSFVEKKLISENGLLSGIFMNFFHDGIESCLINPAGGKDIKEYYKKEGKDLVYTGLKEKEETFELF